MEPELLEARVRHHLSNQCDEPLAGGDAFRTLRLREDLGLDSLQALSLLLDLESELDITLAEEELEALQTVGDVVAAIHAHASLRGP